MNSTIVFAVSLSFVANKYVCMYVSSNHCSIVFSVCSLRDDNMTSKPTWKPKYANSILESCEYFCQISLKLIHVISSYTISNLGHILRHSVLDSYYPSVLVLPAQNLSWECLHVVKLIIYGIL